MNRSTASIRVMLSAYLLVLFAGGARSIRVQFGTNDGPIVPPTPEPKVVPVPPFRPPAPVWEPQPDDLPDPNVTWRPLFIPNPLYTRVNFKPQENVPSTDQAPTQPPQQSTTVIHRAPALVPSSQPPPPLAPVQTSAQRFVSAYLPKKPAAAPTSTQFYNLPAVGQTLSSQSLPGVGLRYFVPAQPQPTHQPKEDLHRYEETKHNHVDNNEVEHQNVAGSHDAIYVYEKEATRRARHSLEGYHTQPVYYFQWPVYVPHRNY